MQSLTSKIDNNINSKPKKQSGKMFEYNQLRCPKCQHIFSPDTDMPLYMSHVKDCHSNKKPKQEPKQQFVYEKIAIDNSMTKFKWEKRPKQKISHTVEGMARADVKKLSFQEKEHWFRRKIESLRIPWTSGADWLKLQKQNILMHSLSQIQKINLHKQVKVQLIGQKVNDAGGLLRQWIHMVIKQIFDFNTGIFIFANTDDTMYRLKWDDEMDEYFSGQLLYLLGVVIGKAMFERIPVNCFMDRALLRQLCGGAVQLSDVYGYDTELYKNWKYILDQPNISEDLQTYFVTYKNNGGTLQEIQLLQGHKDIKVDNDNKELYISLCIETHTKNHIQRSLTQILKGIDRVFTTEWLQIFQPHELEMILYGVPFIDLQDWHDNTEYKEPYNRKHQVIKWFWQVMEEFDQEQLGKVLHFCTASTRTPIHGFSRLQSNRGNYSKFLIVCSEYHKKNPYPKGHTCFNRLELPLYPNLETLRMYLTAISKNQLDGIFGLD